mgnify:FL=1
MRLPRREKKRPYVPVASFGDLAFLLIIFFMVASTFMREKHVKAREASSPDIEKAELKPISVILDSEGQLWLQGQKCPPDALEAAVSALLEGAREKAVMLKIDKGQPQEKYGKVLLALSGAGADILLVGVREGQSARPATPN